MASAVVPPGSWSSRKIVFFVAGVAATAFWITVASVLLDWTPPPDTRRDVVGFVRSIWLGLNWKLTLIGIVGIGVCVILLVRNLKRLWDVVVRSRDIRPPGSYER